MSTKSIIIAAFAFVFPLAIVAMLNADYFSQLFEIDPRRGKLVYFQPIGG